MDANRGTLEASAVHKLGPHTDGGQRKRQPAATSACGRKGRRLVREYQIRSP